MKSTDLVFESTGFRLNWVTNNWKSATGLPRDPPLAAFGEIQAGEVATYFLSLPEDQRPTAIWSSPYYRCIQTAKPISIALGVPILIEHGLSEWYSPVEPGTGLHPRPSSAVSLQTHFPEIDPTTWSSVWYPSRKGEDVGEVHERVAGFLEAFVPEIERRSAHKRVLVVSHAATAIALARVLVGDRVLPLRIACCSLTMVEKKDDARQKQEGAWEARMLGSGSHLKEGSQRDWGFEDIQIADGKVMFFLLVGVTTTPCLIFWILFLNQVVNDHGVPGTEHEVDEPVGCQLKDLTQARM
ncbi:hypothetical protein EW146_g1384 [Bondarzewia mesenterica]|uniref:Phosphoglycerate mutase-like protein n=1 Tax=Bondarzewia mesenterica TaxID=1095465 RepID=A0A4S4M5U5_9AGAM|nr:hypothetical protein EW146_g1384 [Bondarzewia mesenterica]